MYDGLLGGLVFWTGVRLKENSKGEQSRRAVKESKAGISG